jgi:hypothetical protein
MEENNSNTETKMNAATALDTRIAEMTEQQVLDGLKCLKDMFGMINDGKWSDEGKRVRAGLLCSLEDVHGWSEYRAERIEAEMFWGPEMVANVDAMHAAGVI